MENKLKQPPQLVIITSSSSYLVYQVSNNNSSNPFELQSPQNDSLLTLEEAFPMFLPEMAHISKFILCYSLTWFLVWPLQPGLRIFLMFLLVSTPSYYFPQLARQGRGIRVDCGLFKLWLIWFATAAYWK
ncbi:hypothetical protein PIB30_049209 [Stylosanthes scabra]|uniref:Uncharacterized protein n=1 Tax=Stylosanthes scabra TaxID=79078 RepID=A0ABU6YFV9_9FABA|nr:hypothetical protein [Stylosanthes scabra]